MPSISNLFHVAIKTNDLDATVRFYTEVLGLHKVARPDFGYPGAWLAAPGGAAIIHLYAGGPALGAEGRAPYGTAAIDHVSITATRFPWVHREVQETRFGLARIQRPGCQAVAIVRLRPEWR